MLFSLPKHFQIEYKFIGSWKSFCLLHIFKGCTYKYLLDMKIQCPNTNHLTPGLWICTAMMNNRWKFYILRVPHFELRHAFQGRCSLGHRGAFKKHVFIAKICFYSPTQTEENIILWNEVWLKIESKLIANL